MDSLHQLRLHTTRNFTRHLRNTTATQFQHKGIVHIKANATTRRNGQLTNTQLFTRRRRRHHFTSVSTITVNQGQVTTLFKRYFRHQRAIRHRFTRAISTTTRRNVTRTRIRRALHTRRHTHTQHTNHKGRMNQTTRLRPINRRVHQNTRFLLLVIMINEGLLLTGMVHRTTANFISTQNTNTRRCTSTPITRNLSHTVSIHAGLRHNFR